MDHRPRIAKLPDAAHAPLVLGGVLGVFQAAGGLDPLQDAVFEAVAHRVYGLDPAGGTVHPVTVEQLEEAGVDDEARHQVVQLAVVLELVAHPLQPAAAKAVDHAAHRLGVQVEAVHAARLQAEHHLVLLRADLRRASWYAHETEREAAHHRLIELVRSKVAYEGVVPDEAIARKWHALADCPEGSWGRGVAEFYARHRFPYPGDRHGIYEIGALHDFVHVLADYDATPEGEIDVFGFIAATMPAEQGLVLLAVTLAMFQNGAIHRVEGKVVKIGREDTLSDPQAVDRFADALARGRACTVDVLGGIDHFALAAEPLDDLRRRFGIPPRQL